MSRPDTILRRLTSAAEELRGTFMMSRSRPSMRYRIAQPVDLRLDVDVACAAAHGLAHDARGESDGRCLVGRALEVVLVDGFGLVGDVRQFGVLLEDRPHAAELVLGSASRC